MIIGQENVRLANLWETFFPIENECSNLLFVSEHHDNATPGDGLYLLLSLEYTNVFYV